MVHVGWPGHARAEEEAGTVVAPILRHSATGPVWLLHHRALKFPRMGLTQHEGRYWGSWNCGGRHSPPVIHDASRVVLLRCCVGLALAQLVHRTFPEMAGQADARRQLPWAIVGVGRIALAVVVCVPAPPSSGQRHIAGKSKGAALALPSFPSPVRRAGRRQQMLRLPMPACTDSVGICKSPLIHAHSGAHRSSHLARQSSVLGRLLLW